ncbi:MAG: endonuclease/exonuclease/phosphatase [Pseudomonadota bacterium]
MIRPGSVTLGTFNIAELGRIANRNDHGWVFLARICSRFDLLAIQEVADNLEGLLHLRKKLSGNFSLVISDMTGTFPGTRGNPERLAFLYRPERIRHTGLASDITYDRSQVTANLFEHRLDFDQAWEQHVERLGAWQERCRQAEAAGKRKPSRPSLILPRFLTFIRQPHCASFEIIGKNGAPSLSLLAVNAHLLYGEDPRERRWEFEALLEWLAVRAKQRENLYARCMIMLGDCNLEFESAGIKRDEINEQLKELNSTRLKSKHAAKVNFPLLTPHPEKGELRTNARQHQTYDQIALFAHDDELPSSDKNAGAGQGGPNAYDYGVFNFSDLIAEALHDKAFKALSSDDRDYIYRRCKNHISDHLPAWIRLPLPGA